MLTPTLCALFTLSAVAVTLTLEYTLARADAQGKAAPSIHWWGAAIGKTCSSVGFLALFAISVTQISPDHHSAHPTWLGAALIASAIGDVALIGKSDRCFLVGLGSFLLGHFAFMVAFALPGSAQAQLSLSDLAFWGVTGLSLLISGGASVFAYRYFRASMPVKLRIPSLIYTSVIALMVAAAGAHAYLEQCGYVALGAVAFWLSDLAVAQQRFRGDVLPLGGFYVRLWGLPLYYIAQLILAAEPSRAFTM